MDQSLLAVTRALSQISFGLRSGTKASGHGCWRCDREMMPGVLPEGTMSEGDHAAGTVR